MTKLHLNEGDRVRYIKKPSKLFGWIGVVSKVTGGPSQCGEYHIAYDNGCRLAYPKVKAHEYLEKVTEPVTGDRHAMAYEWWYGTDYAHMYQADLSEIERISIAAGNILHAWQKTHPAVDISMADVPPPRKVLKRVRRNVLTGWTQDELVAQYGHAAGVRDFNTRALGKTTGQVLACIADAINNPGKPVAINGVDHARARPGNSTSWTTLNKHFLATIESTIDKLDLKGFTVEPKKGIMTFNPIVVEETYVEVHNAR